MVNRELLLCFDKSKPNVTGGVQKMMRDLWYDLSLHELMEMSMIYMGMSWFDMVYEIVIIQDERTTSQLTNNSTISTISKSTNNQAKAKRHQQVYRRQIKTKKDLHGAHHPLNKSNSESQMVAASWMHFGFGASGKSAHVSHSLSLPHCWQSL